MHLELDHQTLDALKNEAEKAGKSIDDFISSRLLESEPGPAFPPKQPLDLEAVKDLESDDDVEKHLLLVARVPEPLDYHSCSRINIDQLNRALQQIP